MDAYLFAFPPPYRRLLQPHFGHFRDIPPFPILICIWVPTDPFLAWASITAQDNSEPGSWREKREEDLCFGKGISSTILRFRFFFFPQKLNSEWRLAGWPRLSGTWCSGLLLSCCCVSLVGMGPEACEGVKGRAWAPGACIAFLSFFSQVTTTPLTSLPRRRRVWIALGCSKGSSLFFAPVLSSLGSPRTG